MCGRFLLTTSGETLANEFDLDAAPALAARYNIAPSQTVPLIRINEGGTHRECAFARWGLVPSWAKEASFQYSTINARAETLTEKPAFRGPFRRRRCLVPADGFYEWKDLGKKHKQPHVIRPVDGRPLAFAGLWDRWLSSTGEPLDSMTIVTTTANELLRPLHERMPVILSPEYFALWLDPRRQNPEELLSLLVPCRDELLTLTPVSSYVSNARNEGPRCLDPEADLFV